MANEKQTSLRILKPSKKIHHPAAFYGILGFCTGVIFSSMVSYIYLNTLIHNAIMRNLVSANISQTEPGFLEKKQEVLELETRFIQPDIQTNQFVQDEEHRVELLPSKNDDLSKILLHQDQSEPRAKSLNKTIIVTKETAVSP
ncbi:hypothetical protein AY606_06875 [Acinetobacter sp. SFB]|uniref:hypothetical protein n=1 Tax=Acinetobacter sp. SFB TaxID=1805634 RepID=UPI0007D81173|nr:hypothetical protein [Acinetobacter sp. SFB]OAL79143.1 hypothetical protein AY606_06875 [Acinetobacter sp. SFB]